MPTDASIVETAYGGVFYLINVALFLGLYGDFMNPAAPGLALPVWDFVALFGQAWLGAQIETDPVWSLLARLAGRTDQMPPGTGFEPPDRWRVPREWLTPFTPLPWHWSAEGGRLRAWWPERFTLLDLPLEQGDPAAQLARECAAYAGASALDLRPDRWAGPADTPALARWAGWLRPYLDARIRRALGLGTGDDLPALLCEHRARVFVTATHLDVVLSLEQLPIAVRLAGLDRNPGWVPAAGRFITFHFE
ncbi:MAG TPA: hypothetical protein VF897_14700 [Roseiflexaceae bacterium]